MGLLQGSHHIDILRALRAKRLEIYLNFACILAAVWQPERNSETLIGCPPDTEIFSKRRKIYTFCVEDMSLELSDHSSSLLKLEAHKDSFAFTFTLTLRDMIKSKLSLWQVLSLKSP